MSQSYASGEKGGRGQWWAMPASRWPHCNSWHSSQVLSYCLVLAKNIRLHQKQKQEEEERAVQGQRRRPAFPESLGRTQFVPGSEGHPCVTIPLGLTLQRSLRAGAARWVLRFEGAAKRDGGQKY